MFQLIPAKMNINFVKYRHFWAGMSIVAIIASLIMVAVKGLNYGIDFRGGAEVQLRFKNVIPISELRTLLEESKSFKNLTLQQLGEGDSKEFLAKLGGDEADLQSVGDKVKNAVAKKISPEEFEIVRTDVVGPQAGEQLRKSGFLSMLYALLCIFIYVALRFESRYSPGAVLALVHDSMITVGIFVLTQKEFSLQILAAILTIIGYSNNDTIIVFDRIRETLSLHPNRPLEENINISINETLSRTILTSLCTFMVTFSLMIFGGGVISDFAFTMCIGIVVGTYSSIFIASPILIYITQWQNKRSQSDKGTKSGPQLSAFASGP